MLKKNQKIELEITGITSEGNGVGRYEDIAVFVPATAVGDQITAHIVKVQKNYAFARVDKVIKPSKDRIDPDCPVYVPCGGCVFRHMTYEAELQAKQERVLDAMRRIAHLSVPYKPIVGADDPNGYRNKAQYPVAIENETLKIGFYAARSHRIINCRSCCLQPEEFTQAIKAFEKWIQDQKISTYDEMTHTGLLRHIYLRKAVATGEIMAGAVINGTSLPQQEYLIECLREQVEGLKSVIININRERTNVILGNVCQTVWGQDHITDNLCGLEFRISPLSFYQVNRNQAEKLYHIAKHYADLTGEETVLDLYCGTGTIGLTTAKEAKKIIGVEVIPQAVEDAKINADLNNIQNAEFICADAAQAALKLKDEGITPDVVIIDPPRKGCEASLIHTVADMNPSRIVYVSCDPATLARDLKLFDELGYQAQELTPVDMFPRTAHVETVVLMSRVIL